jgi:hypothetical protein
MIFRYADRPTVLGGHMRPAETGFAAPADAPRGRLGERVKQKLRAATPIDPAGPGGRDPSNIYRYLVRAGSPMPTPIVP